MQIKNTQNSYGLVSVSFHWIMGLIMIGLVIAGLMLADELIPDENRRAVMGLHKSFGITILMLIGLRLLWRFTNLVPKLPADMAGWKKGLAHLVHFGLYVSMIVMPLSGWGMSSAGGHPVNFFGLFELPALVEKNKELGKVFHEIHEIAGFVLIGLFALHVGAALLHHFIYKDNVLKRMLMR